jgi:hypothetical protein
VSDPPSPYPGQSEHGKAGVTMPALGSQQDQGGDDGDLLSGVTLKSFEAKPAAIGPFGTSVLSWAVEGPPHVHIELNGQVVAKAGQQIVQPTHDSEYRLTAHAGQATKSLGSIRVSVDRSSCERFEIGNARAAIESPLRAGIGNSADLSFRQDPIYRFGQQVGTKPDVTISFAPGRIRLQLRLRQHIDHWYIPDPGVDVDASFGLVVQDGKLQATAEQISLDVLVPPYLWLIPGAALGLPIAIDMAKESGTKRLHSVIHGLGQVLDAFAVRPPGKRLSTVRVDDGNNGSGIVELTACSEDLLVKAAEVSGVAVVAMQ